MHGALVARDKILLVTCAGYVYSTMSGWEIDVVSCGKIVDLAISQV